MTWLYKAHGLARPKTCRAAAIHVLRTFPECTDVGELTALVKDTLHNWGYYVSYSHQIADAMRAVAKYDARWME